ncbi:DUF4097 family beta strand repeat-containing protein [Microtetraspora sp. NBRC 16547]|uniref:DUF4097 family beta strand repeat-containing protein n=1 Tax=Microtetraspora sp. NBRC 16547 TaxID=3030993 RepID=UPI0024A000FE|nr:DUF4097 family beta strand repeat-containing protein [Microtetraspora sp. NBRC 16547]GLW97287.1 hypothetical protein Misp02_13740 [Microtetraspora sp. NBRC 16547]
MKRIMMAGGALAAAALLTGCGLTGIGGPTSEDTVTYQVTDKVAELNVKGGAGDIVISETGGSAVRVVETLRWRGEKPETVHKVDGDLLLMSYNCPAKWDNCYVNYKIEIPQGLRVDVTSGSGDITLRSLTGPIEVSAGSGDVSGTGLAGKKIFARTGSGDSELRYTAAPDSVETKSGSGNATLYVPDGPYDVKTSVRSGDVRVSVKKDASSPHKVTMTAGSGDVSVLPG